MNKLISSSLDSVLNTMQAQKVHANNLVNVSTGGFRADYLNVIAQFETQAGTEVLQNSLSHWSDTDVGPLMQTGHSLDLAIEGEGWFAVQDAVGQEAYSRLGNLEVDEEGVLKNGNGQPLMAEGGPLILPPYEKVVIGNDGRVSIQVDGADANELVEVGFIKLVNPPAETMVKGTDGLFRLDTGLAAPLDAEVSVVSGYLEGSNVSAVKEMVAFLNLSRNFEMHMKTIQSSEKVGESGLRLLQA